MSAIYFPFLWVILIIYIYILPQSNVATGNPLFHKRFIAGKTSFYEWWIFQQAMFVRHHLPVTGEEHMQFVFQRILVE